ncbi:MAG: hypothetical protein RLN83_07860 [Balneola sp.]|tara:strand:+ start:18706 stop:19092 length:387 start_codon:yes stop_codon:yes gene_type:complete
MGTRKRQIATEYRIIKKKHKNDANSAFDYVLSLDEFDQILADKKDQFDYKVTRMLQANGLDTTDFRDKLDNIWSQIARKYKQPDWERYTRVLTIVPGFPDRTQTRKIALWSDYLEAVGHLVEKISKDG